MNHKVIMTNQIVWKAYLYYFVISNYSNHIKVTKGDFFLLPFLCVKGYFCIYAKYKKVLFNISSDTFKAQFY